MIQVSHLRAVDLTEEEVTRCRELSFGDEGYMCEDLDRILIEERRWRYRYSQAFLLRVDGQIVGWSLVEPIYRKHRWTAHFFVDPAHRRRGYGGILLANANAICQQPYCFVDEENEAFFGRYPSLCTDYGDLVYEE